MGLKRVLNISTVFKRKCFNKLKQILYGWNRKATCMDRLNKFSSFSNKYGQQDNFNCRSANVSPMKFSNPLLGESRRNTDFSSARRNGTSFTVANLMEIQQKFIEQKDDDKAYKVFKNLLKEKKKIQLENLGYTVVTKKLESPKKKRKKKNKSKKSKKQNVLDSKASMILSNIESVEKYVKRFCEEKMIEIDEDLIDLAETIQLEAEQILQESLERDIKQAEEENKKALAKFLQEANQPQQLCLNMQIVQNKGMANDDDLSKIQELSEDEPDSAGQEYNSFSNKSISVSSPINIQNQSRNQFSANDFKEILETVTFEITPKAQEQKQQEAQLEEIHEKSSQQEQSCDKQVLGEVNPRSQSSQDQINSDQLKKNSRSNSPASDISSQKSDEDDQGSFLNMRKIYRSKSQITSQNFNSLQQRRLCRLITLDRNKHDKSLEHLLSPKNAIYQSSHIKVAKSFDNVNIERKFTDINRGMENDMRSNTLRRLNTGNLEPEIQEEKPKEKTIHEILQEQFDQYQKEKEEKRRVKLNLKQINEKQENSEECSIESKESDEDDSDIIEEEEMHKLMQNRRKAIFGELTPAKRD